MNNSAFKKYVPRIVFSSLTFCSESKAEQLHWLKWTQHCPKHTQSSTDLEMYETKWNTERRNRTHKHTRCLKYKLKYKTTLYPAQLTMGIYSINFVDIWLPILCFAFLFFRDRVDLKQWPCNIGLRLINQVHSEGYMIWVNYKVML